MEEEDDDDFEIDDLILDLEREPTINKLDNSPNQKGLNYGKDTINVYR